MGTCKEGERSGDAQGHWGSGVWGTVSEKDSDAAHCRWHFY
jgi:hypothetical protein